MLAENKKRSAEEDLEQEKQPKRLKRESSSTGNLRQSSGSWKDDEFPEELNDDDGEYLVEDDGSGENDDVLASDSVKEKPFTFLDNEEFVEELLQTALENVGPYVPFSSEESENVGWKCLHLLRVLDWNLGKIDSILDDLPKLCAKAGILEECPEEEVPDAITCSVCDEKYDGVDTSALECNHRFCNECWKGSINVAIDSSTYQQIFENMKCMKVDCALSVLGPLIKLVSTEKDWQHYLRMIIKSYTEVNHAIYSICPSCSKVAKANALSNTVSKTVPCECGTSFCFGCNLPPHVPASCIDLEKWKTKDDDDQASLNFIKATTTQCPKCGRALDRITACNHITCGCNHQFCFVCKQQWGSCSIYSCSKYKTVEEQQEAEGKEFAPGYKTSSDWLVQHERYVAFSKKYVAAKAKSSFATKLMERMVEKTLQYREEKPGGNPQFMIDGCEILIKAWNILQYTYVWGYFNIPPKICPQKNIYEWQIKSYEKLAEDLEKLLVAPVSSIDHLKTKHLYTLIENSLIKKIEEAEDLLALFSEKSMGTVVPSSVLARWTCPHCNYSNHPTEQEKACGHCSKPRPEVKILWFGTED